MRLRAELLRLLEKIADALRTRGVEVPVARRMMHARKPFRSSTFPVVRPTSSFGHKFREAIGTL